MKPIDFSALPAISAVLKKMKANPDYYTGASIKVKWEFVEDEEITPDQIKDVSLGSFITYKGKKVLLYILDQDKWYFDIHRALPKYHVAWCKTLKTMHESGKYNKYCVSTKTNGVFKIRIVDGKKVLEERNERLCVCKNCLSALNWHGYKDKNKDKNIQKRIFEEFSLEEFFNEYNNDNNLNFPFIPEYSEITAPPNIYPDDWEIISKELRNRRLSCTKCGRHFSQKDIGELHVHHRDGRKNNIARSNLVVLCEKCHQKEHPTHKISHIKSSKH